MANQIKRFNAGLQRVKDHLLNIPIVVQLIFRTAEESGNHDVPYIAAGVAYYSFLSIFPFLLGDLRGRGNKASLFHR